MAAATQSTNTSNRSANKMSDGLQIAISRSAGQITNKMEELAFRVRKTNPSLQKALNEQREKWDNFVKQHPDLEIDETKIAAREARRSEARSRRG